MPGGIAVKAGVDDRQAAGGFVPDAAAVSTAGYVAVLDGEVGDSDITRG